MARSINQGTPARLGHRITTGTRQVLSHLLLAATLLFALAVQQAHAQSVDLVVNIVSDQPAYMSFDEQFFTVTISNNGPATATNVVLVVEHPVADAPFEASATCQALAGPNPNGLAVCPLGSGTAPSSFFVRTSQNSFSVTIPSIPSQSQVQVDFSTRVRCPSNTHGSIDEGLCFGVPVGNFPVSAAVNASQSDSESQTNISTTNIVLFPPDVQYKVQITSAPASANAGDVIFYDFEISSFGLQPSDKLNLLAKIKGEAGTMVPLNPTNNPFGSLGSTLPNTQLQAIDCLSTALGTFPPASVFPSPPASWQTCPSTGLIPIPTPISPTNAAPVTGFPLGGFLDNLPGTLDGPSGGGVMRFRAQVLVGDPVCVATPDSGVRDLVFAVSVNGLFGTDLVAPGPADNTATAVTTVAGNCQNADIEFTTQAVPPSFSLDGSGNASWVHEATVSNLGTAAATNVPVEFEHQHYAFSETLGTMTCTSTGGGVCPTALQLSAGVIANASTYFKFATTLATLPSGASVTFSQPVTINRTTCWNTNSALIDLRGQADPSPALFDPVYSATTPPEPPLFTPGSNPFFGNNGRQTIATVTGMVPCGGGGSSTEIKLEKFGPFASIADANAGTPLIGQSAGLFIADATTVFYKFVVTNLNTANAVLLGNISDTNFFVSGLASSPASGFISPGSITCVASPSTATCHELVSPSPPSAGYNQSLTLSYDPILHGGNSEVALAPSATLTYIVPFTMPTHLNQCAGAQLTSNRAQAAYRDAIGNPIFTPQTIVSQYIGTPTCVPGTLDVQKQILPPATTSSIPLSGLISYQITLTNTSTTATLDIPRLVDSTSVAGVTSSIVSIVCTPVAGGALCPTNAVVPGMQTPASGPAIPLPDPLTIDHEWGAAGNNTFPPGSSVKFVVTVQLANPTGQFSCIFNQVLFTGQNDPNGWVPGSSSAVSCPPRGPLLSLQKQVSSQIAAPGSLVTYTVTVLNIGGAAADGAVLFDPLPPALFTDNPSGYSNVTCTDITSSSFIPNPPGTVVCPSVVSTATGLTTTIATFGTNTALQFTYQAMMPATPVSIDNLATVSAPSVSGLSFGVGTAQSHQNVQVIMEPESELVGVPTLQTWKLGLLVMLLLILGFRRLDVDRSRAGW